MGFESEKFEKTLYLATPGDRTRIAGVAGLYANHYTKKIAC